MSAKPTCEFCGVESSSSGITLHQKKCPDKALADVMALPPDKQPAIRWGLVSADLATHTITVVNEPSKWSPNVGVPPWSVVQSTYAAQIETITRASRLSTASGVAKPKPITVGSRGEYLPRIIESADCTDVELVRKSREAMIPVLLYGPPGTGKTALAEAAFGEDLVTLSGSGDTEVSDFVGGYVQAADGTFQWVDGPLIEAMEKGWPFFVDEVALIDTRVLAVMYSALDGRGEVRVSANPDKPVVKAKDGFYILAATNPDVPGAVMSDALLSRFRVQIQLESNYDIAADLGVSKQIILAAKNLRKKALNGEVLREFSLRDLLGFRDLEKTYGVDFALQNLLGTVDPGDRPVVSELLANIYGVTIEPLVLS